MKTVSGYIRAIPSGIPIKDVPVHIVSEVTGADVPPGGMIMANTLNPVNTDHTTGKFLWTTELSPGPIRVEAEYLPGEWKRRSGYEVMQSGTSFLSDIADSFNVFENGVLNTSGQGFSASQAGKVLTLHSGAAFIFGNLLQTNTDRQFTLANNTTLAQRIDMLVLKQWVAGPYLGRQDIELIPGTVTNTAPDFNSPDPNIYWLPIYYTTLPNGGSSFTLTDARFYSYVFQSITNINDMFRSFGNSATSSADTTSSDQSIYRDILEVPFTLPGAPGGGPAKWTVHIWGSALFGTSASGQAGHRRVQIWTGSSGGTAIDTGTDTAFQTTVTPNYTSYPVDETKTNLGNGSYRVRMLFKVDTAAAGSTVITARGPELHGLAWRTS